MADVNKKVFDAQTLLHSVSDLRAIQDLYMLDELSTIYPRRLVNNGILKNCLPGEETIITRNSPSDMHLFYLKQIIYSALVPDIRLFKVVNGRDEDTGARIKEKVVEIEFPRSLKNNTLGDTNSDLDLSRPVLERRGQIGIKSFEWEYVGTNTFSSERDIRATLTLTMDGIGALSTVRKNKKGQSYRILDAIIQADCFKKSGLNIQRPNEPASQTATEGPAIPSNQSLKYDAGCYEILIEAGYQIDNNKINELIGQMGLQGKSGVNFQKAKIKQALNKLDFRKMRSCMYLNTVDHSFSFEQNGKVECTISYIARSITADRSPEANILLSQEQGKRIDQVNSELEQVKKDISDMENGAIPVERLPNLSPQARRRAGAFGAPLPQAFGAATPDGPLASVGTTTSFGERTNLDEAKEQLKRLEERKEEVLVQARNAFFDNVLKKLLEPQILPTVAGERIYSLVLREEGARLYEKYLENPTIQKLTIFRDEFAKLQELKRSDTKEVAEALREEAGSVSLIGDLGAVAVIGLAALGRRGSFLPSLLGLTTSSSVVEVDDPVYRVPFVFFGDVLDAVISHAGPERFRDYRYVLSNLTMKSPLTDTEEVRIPIGGIPITIELLRSVIEKEIKAAKRTKYTLLQFIRMFLNNVLKEAIGRQTVKLSSNNSINFKSTAFIHYATKTNPDPTVASDARTFDIVSLNPETTRVIEREAITDILDPVTLEPIPGQSESFFESEEAPAPPSVLSRLNSACADETFLKADNLRILNIIAIHETENIDFSKRQYGDLEEDFLRYIPHFAHGQPYGLIKKATLSKVDIPKFREMRFEQLGDDNPDTYLTNFYNATFEMIGNDLNTLGGHIYLDPAGLAPDGSLGSPNDPESLSYIMGLGGVHLITKISHKMSPGNYTTYVDTRWTNRGALKITGGDNDGQ